LIYIVLEEKIIAFFKKFLERITTYLEKAREEWKGGHEANRLVTLDTSTEFFRIWAICQFIFCMIDKKATTTDMETFGHGMIWGGTTLVFLFGQYLRYEAFNFCDHVLNISTLVKEKKKNEDLEAFLVNARRIRSLNSRIVNCLKTYHSPPQNKIEIFSPPDTEEFTKMKVIISKEEEVQTLYEEEIPEGDGNVFNKFMNIMKTVDDDDEGEDKIAELDEDDNKPDKDEEGPPPPPDSEDGPPPPPDFN